MAYLGRRFMGEPHKVVTEYIEGLTESYPGLQYLDGFPRVKVVLRADVSSSTYDKVAIISGRTLEAIHGGGSGHEPAHAGFVGEGMLTAAICGDVFACPPVDAILAGIRAVTGPKGCLLIVKNYSGDRLNFGLAAEEAKSEGYKIETVIVGDDCALRYPNVIPGRRGLAGIILVQKVAGAAAAAGLSLTSVAAEAKSVTEMLGTMTVALSGCTLPGHITPERLAYGKMELGIGIHGEHGIAVEDVLSVDVLVPFILKKILSKETNFAPIKPGSRVVALINGLGATPIMELMIVAGKAIPDLQLNHGLAVARAYTGSFMTSLDMAGFSISLMMAEADVLPRLDAPTTAPAWPVGVDGSYPPPPKIPLRMPKPPAEKSLGRPLQLNEQGQTLEAAIVAAANAIIDIERGLNEWDGKLGDRDCGTNMCKGAKAILEDIKNYPLNDAAETVNAIASSLGRVLRGRCGMIHRIFCKAAYTQLKRCTETAISSKEWAQALASSIDAVSKYGGAIAGYRTYLDALIPALSVLQENLKGGVDPCTAFVASSGAALAGAKSTIDMRDPSEDQARKDELQVGGGLTIRNTILATFPDPGAMAAAVWYRAAALAVKERHKAASSSSAIATSS